MFHSVTTSGIVSLVATDSGTPTSERSRLGSGEITVLLEKSTLFPESEPLNLPSFPFSLCVRVLGAYLIYGELVEYQKLRYQNMWLYDIVTNQQDPVR